MQARDLDVALTRHIWEALTKERLVLLPLALLVLRRTIVAEAARLTTRPAPARRSAAFFYPVD